MMTENQKLFDDFKKIHDQYMENAESIKEKFNAEGRKVQDVIRKYEKQLVLSTERSTYSKFSSNLSDKFWSEVRKVFPKIDFVGVK